MSEGQTAFLFPGQGSQTPGMGRELYDTYPESREVFEAADRALGMALSDVIFAGSEAELGRTENTQPAILTVSIAAWRALTARGVHPDRVAGHSLGEYSALVAAGALDFADAVRLVRKRGRYMQEAVPVGVGAMAAIVGLAAKVVEDACHEAARGEVVVAANYNGPDQTVIAGTADAVRRAVALCDAHGAKRAIMLPVSAPFHSPLMAPAAERLAHDLAATPFQDLNVPLICNVSADEVRRGEVARAALLGQVTAPVRWTESIQALIASGIRSVIEVGPGRVLVGLARRIDRSLELGNVEDSKGLEKLLASREAGR